MYMYIYITNIIVKGDILLIDHYYSFNYKRLNDTYLLYLFPFYFKLICTPIPFQNSLK